MCLCVTGFSSSPSLFFLFLGCSENLGWGVASPHPPHLNTPLYFACSLACLGQSPLSICTLQFSWFKECTLYNVHCTCKDYCMIWQTIVVCKNAPKWTRKVNLMDVNQCTMRICASSCAKLR